MKAERLFGVRGRAAVELAPFRVTVNAIAPGCFYTNIGGASAW